MKLILINIIVILTFFCLPTFSQSFISVQGSFNYWQHSELYGPGAGFGYHYKKDKLLFSAQYDYGYGTYDRLKKFDNVDYDSWSTIMVLRNYGSWSDYICCHSLDDIYELPGVTDYGKQHQLSLQIGYSLKQSKSVEYLVKLGGFSAVVEQFFTFKNLPIYYLDLVPFYRGPLNYIPSTSRKILTLGVNGEFSIQFSKNSKIWEPFIVGGIGPKYSSYASVGLRLSTLLKKKS